MLDSGVEKSTVGSYLFIVNTASDRRPNPLDVFLLNAYKSITGFISPTTLCVALVAIWWMRSNQSQTTQSFSQNPITHYDDYDDDSYDDSTDDSNSNFTNDPYDHPFDYSHYRVDSYGRDAIVGGLV